MRTHPAPDAVTEVDAALLLSLLEIRPNALAAPPVAPVRRRPRDAEAERQRHHEALMQQYTATWREIEHLDRLNLQIILVFITLMSFYIGMVDQRVSDPHLLAAAITLFGLCVCGAIARLRTLLRQYHRLAAVIERATAMVVLCEPPPRWFARIKLSSYLLTVVITFTALAVIRTYLQG